MTYEQYGSGPWLVSVQTDDLNGMYRFETKEAAEDYQKKNGGQLSRKPGKFGDIRERAAMGDGV